MFPILKALIKWPLITLTIGALVYSNHRRIEYTVNRVWFALNRAEDGYIEKNRALRLRIHYEINENGGLETYLVSRFEPLPIYKRENGIMVGTPEYNFNNFTDREKAYLCHGTVSKKEKKGTKIIPEQDTSLIDKLSDIVTDEKLF